LSPRSERNRHGDIYEALDRNIPIDAVLERKVRHAGEAGQPFAPVRTLFAGG
jgi:hypothetical protein